MTNIVLSSTYESVAMKVEQVCSLSDHGLKSLVLPSHEFSLCRTQSGSCIPYSKEISQSVRKMGGFQNILVPL